MPIYEYECSGCGNVEEALQKFSDSPLTTCKKCSGQLHKLISHSSFHLKGTGWYVTDYANKSKTNTATATTDQDKSKNSADSDSTKKTNNDSKDSTTASKT